MLNLTKEEKLVLVFLVACFIVGSGAGFYKKQFQGPSLPDASSSAKSGQSQSVEQKININKAPFSELIKLKGVGVKTASRIIDYRAENGPFFYKEDLMKIRGIGRSKFELIEKDIIVE